jgi:flagellar hook assembly protein FlgD
MTIDGCAGAAVITVTTLKGQAIRTIPVRANRAFWNGRTRSGQNAASGIYVIRAVGNGTAAQNSLAVGY